MSLNYKSNYNQDIRNWLIKVDKYAEDLSKQKLVRRACPVCGSNQSTFFSDNTHFRYEQCKKCSVVYMNPVVDLENVNKGFKGDDDLLMDYFSLMLK